MGRYYDGSGRYLTDELRLADLIAALSQVTDLGMGQPPEDAIRSCLFSATGLARKMGLDERGVGDIYYVTLLQHVGCTAYAHETAASLGGDDIAVGAAAPRSISLIPGSAPIPTIRARKGRKATGSCACRDRSHQPGAEFDGNLHVGNCEVAAHMARRLGLGPASGEA